MPELHEEVTAEDEAQLVAIVDQHVGGHAVEHGHQHAVSREDVLARLELQVRRGQS